MEQEGMDIDYGICPKCKCEDLVYDALKVQDEMIYYPFECNSCGATGKEWFKLEFIEVTIDSEYSKAEDQKECTNCERCGSPDAEYVENPYQKEIYGKSVMEWLCDTCLEDIRGDI